MKIILDTMGFENLVKEPVIAARKFVKKFSNVEIILVGNEVELRKEFNTTNEFKIIHTNVEISQSDEVMHVLRNKKNASMSIAMDLLNEGKVDAMVTAGSTPSFVALGYSKLGVIENISKPAFTPSFPSTNGLGFNMLDVGANIDVDYDDLIDFAIMGSVYVQGIKGIKKPSVGLLNIGTEDHKGLERIRVAHKILKERKEINYVGFVEPRDLLSGNTNVVVTDGFTGNICLKSIEGTFKALISEFKKGYKKPWNWIGALTSIGVFKYVKKTFDYKNNAGAVFLGLKKIAIKTHGSADAQQFYSSLELAKKTYDSKVIEHLKRKFNA